MSLRLVLSAASLALAGPSAAAPWAHAYDGPGRESLDEVRPLADGSALASGTTDSWGAGGADAWLVRVDAEGDIAWQVAVGTPLDDAPVVAAHDDGSSCVLVQPRL